MTRIQMIEAAGNVAKKRHRHLLSDCYGYTEVGEVNK